MTEAALQIIEEVRPTNSCSEGTANEAVFEAGHRFWRDASASDAILAQEISFLVSGALETATLAAAQSCPATHIEALAGRKPDGIIAQMNELPSVQFAHPVVQAEFRKEFAMVRAQSRLAHEIAEGFRSYARSKRRACMVAMT